ncbi:Putative membrane protein YfcA [Helicobacter typhlonius]|uniref:Putative membrane protein YfcA n=1 Tax=Helicobacter typhlonius TaxID=76936 RepID=A0A0S4PT09_9HELI|nr:Putative membrane protein YfcA [Helicobacter typhlonius]
MVVSVGGYRLGKALAHSPSIVFSSINIFFVIFFILIGIVMCAGQIIGASLGQNLR